MAELTAQQYDKLCDEGFKKMDKMRQEGKASSPEYSKLLYELQDLTRKRLVACGLTISTAAPTK